MKSLKQHIEEGLRLSINKCIPITSESLNKIGIYESLRIGINDTPEMLQPKTWKELRQIIEKRFKEFGPGTVSNPVDFNDIDVSEIDTFYNVSDDIGIFDITKFEYINISDWDVSNVKNIAWMFNGCYKLKSIDISNWNVSNVENMFYMFFECVNLKSVGDLSKWNVSNIKNMKYMFYGCENLKTIGDLSNWNVSKVENMENMFTNSGITNIPKWYEV